MTSQHQPDHPHVFSKAAEDYLEHFLRSWSRKLAHSYAVRDSAVGLLMLSVVASTCVGQQVVTNFGRLVEYEHGMTIYDTADRNSATITEIERVPTVSTSQQFQSLVLDSTTGALTNGQYELGSFTEGSTTFDMKTSSAISFSASSEGSFDPETAPDGDWDYVTGRSHTTTTYYDSVKLVGPAEQTGDPATFYMHWRAKGNRLFFEQTTTEINSNVLGSGDITLGSLTRLNNGFYTNMFYDVSMSAYVDHQPLAPYSVSKLEPFLAPEQGDTLPLRQTIELDDIDLIYEVPVKINETFVLQVDLAALLDMELFITTTAEPSIYSQIDLTQTFDSIAFEARDQFGNVMPGIGIQSQIGINYAGAAAAVPEPSGALSLLMIVTMFAGVRRYARSPED